MRILIDLDSTVADIQTPWLRLHNEATGDGLELEDITSWDTHLHCRSGAKVYEVIERPGFYSSLQPLPGAVEAVRKLWSMHDVLIVTATPTAHGAAEKIEWVQRHLPFLTKRQVIVGHEKHLIRADALIDDSPPNARLFRRDNPGALVAGIAFPYNASEPAFTMLGRDYRDTKKAWEEIVDAVARR